MSDTVFCQLSRNSLGFSIGEKLMMKQVLVKFANDFFETMNRSFAIFLADPSLSKLSLFKGLAPRLMNHLGVIG